MKAFIIFVTIVLLIYGTVNYYIYRRIVQAACLSGVWVWALKLFIVMIVLSYPLGRSLGVNSQIGNLFTWIGAFWLGAMVYGLMSALLFDAVRIIDILTGWVPDFVLANRVLAGRLALIGSMITTCILIVSGQVASNNLQVNKVIVYIDKLPVDEHNYSVALFADCHLGTLVGDAMLKKIVSAVNEIEPDLCLIAGDLVDENPANLEWSIDLLKEISAKDGVYAVNGNHEFYAGVEACAKLFGKAGLTLLRDSVLTIDGTLNIAGLDDQTGRRQYQNTGSAISDILKSADKSLPTIMMHHTPVRKAEAQLAGVDLMLSGHTHGGQMWPFGHITKLIYKIGQGFTHYGDMDIYLTNGVGTWGPPVRIGSKPEIVNLILKSKEKG